MDKKFYMDKLAAVHDVIGQLPDDVNICRIYSDYVPDGEDKMCIQINERDDLVPDRVRSMNSIGMDWAEKDYQGLFGPLGAVITVGWCLHRDEPDEEGSDDDDL